MREPARERAGASEDETPVGHAGPGWRGRDVIDSTNFTRAKTVNSSKEEGGGRNGFDRDIGAFLARAETFASVSSVSEANAYAERTAERIMRA